MVLWSQTRPSNANTKKDVLYIIRDWNAKVGSQEIPWVSCNFGFGVQNEAGKGLTEFCQENTLAPSSNNPRDNFTYGHHHMVNTEIRRLYSLHPKMENLYTISKNDWELTVVQIMNTLLPNSELNWRKYGKPLDHSGMTNIKSLIITQWRWEINLKD